MPAKKQTTWEKVRLPLGIVFGLGVTGFGLWKLGLFAGGDNTAEHKKAAKKDAEKPNAQNENIAFNPENIARQLNALFIDNTAFSEYKEATNLILDLSPDQLLDTDNWYKKEFGKSLRTEVLDVNIWQYDWEYFLSFGGETAQAEELRTRVLQYLQTVGI